MLEERIGPELNALLAQVAALVWTTDSDLRILSVDGGASSRVDSTYAVGRRVGDYFVSESVAIGVHEAALRGESGQYEHFTADAPWHVWVDPLRDEDGEIVGAIGVALDMSEHRAHARELATATANMRALVETLPLVVYTATLDFDPRPQFIAPQVEELLGIPQRLFTFDDLRNGIHLDDRARAWAAFDDADVMQLPLTIEYRFVRPDGRVVWIEDASRIVEIDGVPLAQGYLLDITERKRTEEVLARQLEARRRIAEIGRRSLEGMPRVEVVREALALLCDDLGADVGSLLEPTSGELFVTDCFGWKLAGQCAPEGTPGSIVWRTQQTYAGVTPDGPPSQLGELGMQSTIAAPVLVANGDCVGVVTAHARAENAFDESDVRLAEQAANLIAAAIARERLDDQLRASQRLEAVGQLAAGIAHDFNNMLTVIAGYTELALPHADEDGRDHLAQVVLAADRARMLTSQLLAYSRQQVLRKEPLSLVSLVGSIAPMLATLLGENISVVTAGDDATVIADAAQLDNVFVNLAVNARDAMPDGGKLTVRTGSAEVDAATALEQSVEPGRFGTLTVSDTGSGMPPEVRDQIFEPFFTTKGQGRGTGLGLSSVHGTVHQSGGFVTVDSTLGAGSSFTIYLPATEEAVTNAVTQQAPAVPVTNARILLVEDEEIVRDLLIDQLTGIGHTVEAVGSAAHAMIALEHRVADVVLSDVGLPGADGGSLAQAVATRFPDVRVVLMSGYPGDYIADRGVSDEVPLLLKPFTMDELQDAVGRVLA